MRRKRNSPRRKKKAEAVKLVVVISVLTLAAIVAVLVWPSGPGSQAFHPRDYRTEPVPADPLIEILPVGDVDRSAVELVADSIGIAFEVRTRIAGRMALPEPAFDEARGQYSADWMLRVASALRSEDSFRTFLVTNADIYSGDLPCLLSLVSADGRMIVISTARLGGVGRVELPLEQVTARTKRLTVRAVASSLGVKPCDNDCVLAGALLPENLDKTPGYFCPVCATALEDRLKTGIGSPHAHFQAALLYLEDGSIDGAIAELRKAIALKGDYLAAYLNLGELYVQKGWHAEAITVLRKAAAIAPKNVEPRTRLAQLLLLNDQAQSALEELQVALAVDPDSREIHRLLGLTYQFYVGDPRRALAHYRKFLELGGDASLIDGALEDLRQAVEGEK